jgi:hypothetical protein
MDAVRQQWGDYYDTPGWATIWTGIMLRRFNDAHPGSLTEWRTVRNWRKIVERQERPGELKPEHWEIRVHRFLTAGDNRIGSDNPWAIAIRSARRQSYPITEYSIRQIQSLDEDIRQARAMKFETEERERARRTLAPEEEDEMIECLHTSGGPTCPDPVVNADWLTPAHYFAHTGRSSPGNENSNSSLPGWQARSE